MDDHVQLTTDGNSLFSLEVVVQRLGLDEDLTCRFPAIAFRLLDFPTLVIHHLEKNMADKSRPKLQMDSIHELPNQLQELKDRDGSYHLRKGKSCLLKIPPETLNKHLKNTPLYLMVLDAFPDVPKLVANCSIPLDDAMSDIMVNIQRFGPSIPCTEGGKGRLKLFNLMGHDVGWIELGYRLISLGPTVLNHLPSVDALQSELTVKKDNEIVFQAASAVKARGKVETQPKRDGRDKLNSSIGAVINILGDSNEAVVSKVTHEQGNQADEIRQKTCVATQTLKRAKPKKFVKVMSEESEEEHPELSDDLFINNIERPPPLFYNSNQVTSKKTVIHKDTDFDESESEFSDLSIQTGTIAPADYYKAKKKENASKYKYQANKQSERKASPVRHERPKSAPVAPTDLQDFPILGALLKEITNLQASHISGSKPKAVKLEKQSLSKNQANSKFLRPQVQKLLTKAAYKAKPIGTKSDNKRESESKAEFLHRLSKPRLNDQGKEKAVPGNKSWLRKTPVMGIRKNSLPFGLTRAQKLRIAQHNPNFIESFEMEMDTLRSDVDHSESVTDSKQFSSRFRLNSRTHKVLSGRNPIPLPRLSLTGLEDMTGRTEELRELFSSRMRSGTLSEEELADGRRDKSTTRSQKISIRVPSLEQYKDDRYASDFESDTMASSPPLSRRIDAPGLPEGDSRPNTALTDYSEEFESMPVVSGRDTKTAYTYSEDFDSFHSPVHTSRTHGSATQTARTERSPVHTARTATHTARTDRSPVHTARSATHTARTADSVESSEDVSHKREAPVRSARGRTTILPPFSDIEEEGSAKGSAKDLADRPSPTRTTSPRRRTPRLTRRGSPRPRVKTRPSRTSIDSINTDSVSSYKPTDPDNLQISMSGTFDESMEDLEYVPSKAQPIDQLVAPANMLGYTL